MRGGWAYIFKDDLLSVVQSKFREHLNLEVFFFFFFFFLSSLLSFLFSYSSLLPFAPPVAPFPSFSFQLTKTFRAQPLFSTDERVVAILQALGSSYTKGMEQSFDYSHVFFFFFHCCRITLYFLVLVLVLFFSHSPFSRPLSLLYKSSLSRNKLSLFAHKTCTEI